MSIFDFMSEGVEEALNAMTQQIQKADEVAASLRSVITPLENGGWVGVGAEAFFEDSRLMLEHLQQTRDSMERFHGALTQAMNMALEAMQTINTITQG